MKLKDKKGIEAKMLIGIIVAVICFGIIILFINQIGWTEVIDKETCHQSVLSRSIKGPLGTILRKTVSLKCKTESIVIYDEDEEIIKKKIANAMYDCWWMLGEGKLDFFPGEFFTKNHCMICSTIYFEEKAKRKKVDLFDFLNKTKIAGKDITFMEYFSNEAKEKIIIDTDKNYAVIVLVGEPTFIHNRLFKMTAAGVAVGVVAACTGGIPIILASVAGALSEEALDGYFREKGLYEIPEFSALLNIIEFKPEQIYSIGCTDIQTIP